MLSLSLYSKSEFQDWSILSVSHIKISNSYCGLFWYCWGKNIFMNFGIFAMFCLKRAMAVPKFSLPPYMSRSFPSHLKWPWFFTSTLYIWAGFSTSTLYGLYSAWERVLTATFMAKSFYFYPVWPRIFTSNFYSQEIFIQP